MAYQLMLLTLGAVAVGRALVRGLTARVQPGRALVEIGAGGCLLLVALARQRGPDAPGAAVLDAAATLLLLVMLLVLSRHSPAAPAGHESSR